MVGHFIFERRKLVYWTLLTLLSTALTLIVFRDFLPTFETHLIGGLGMASTRFCG